MIELFRQVLPCNIFLLLLICNILSTDTNATPCDFPKDSLSLTAWPLLVKSPHHELLQVIAIDVQHKSSLSEKIEIRYNGKISVQDSVHLGQNHFEVRVPAVQRQEKVNMQIMIEGSLSVIKEIILHPVQKRAIYLIAHSHNDIGYTNLQTEVEKEQNRYTREAMELIQKTKNYPKGAQFKWNIESLWALENFFRIASDSEKIELIRDVKEGFIGLSAGYCNELTGVCRPEELYHLMDYSRWLYKKYGVASKTYIISDVPGMNWSAIPEFAKRGVRYISDGPNWYGRTGYALQAWGDKPFYWVSSSGKDTILYWQAGEGYGHFFGGITAGPRIRSRLMNYMRELDTTHYPYNMVQIRYVTGDNTAPDPNLPDFVKEWNKKYASPRLIIATVDEMMERFERKYGSELPVDTGDFTPYWEDGVMSSAKEETIAKHGVERLIQAQTLHELLTPSKDDSSLFYKAWRDAILWHEHTWGAFCSISKPDSSFTIAQWKYKQHFALSLDSLSRIILSQWIHTGKVSSRHAYSVYNTSNWTRSNLVYLTKEQSTAGDGIIDKEENHYPTQRLNNGELVFLAKNVPALGEKVFYNVAEKHSFTSQLKVSDHSLENEFVEVTINSATGAIQHFIDKKTGKDFVDNTQRSGLNEYLYVPGSDPEKVEHTSQVRILIKENGPLIASLEIISKAPGTHILRQEIRLVNGMDKIDIINMLNKTKVHTKESVHFAYPVNVPGGKMRLDLGKGIMQPEINQLPGSNKDFASVQRWIDISNDSYGLTITTEESPLIEIGELVNEITKQKHPNNEIINTWKKKTDMSNTFYFYVMNNYWFTNYKADQEGWVTFNYSLFPHNNKFDKTFSERKGLESCQPLLVTPKEKRSLVVN